MKYQTDIKPYPLEQQFERLDRYKQKSKYGVGFYPLGWMLLGGLLLLL